MSLLNLLEEFIMFEKIRKMKNKKGFTLVELIVVLVILAILAALLIPALTGYIDKAKDEAIIAKTRSLVMAAQTLESEKYGQTKTGSTYTHPTAGDIGKLAEVTDGSVTVKYVNAKVSELVYTDATSRVCTYKDNEYKVTTKAASVTATGGDTSGKLDGTT